MRLSIQIASAIAFGSMLLGGSAIAASAKPGWTATSIDALYASCVQEQRDDLDSRLQQKYGKSLDQARSLMQPGEQRTVNDMLKVADSACRCLVDSIVATWTPERAEKLAPGVVQQHVKSALNGSCRMRVAASAGK